MRKPYQLQRTITSRIVHVAIINTSTNEVTIDEFILPKECVTEKDITNEVQSMLAPNRKVAYLKDIADVKSKYVMSETDFVKFATKIKE